MDFLNRLFKFIKSASSRTRYLAPDKPGKIKHYKQKGLYQRPRFEDMAARPVIEYYFSFISLWSYIGSRRFQRLVQETNAHVIHKPIDLMYIFSISGGLPVKQRSAQRQAYRLIEMGRWRRIHGIPIVQHPKYYPADPSLAHRALLAAIKDSGNDSPAVQNFARLGLEAVWARELDIANEATIVRLAEEAGLNGDRLLQKAKTEPLLAEQEIALTKEAEDRQYFGAPLYSFRGELFWGQDRLDMLDDAIKSGRDPIVVPSLP